MLELLLQSLQPLNLLCERGILVKLKLLGLSNTYSTPYLIPPVPVIILETFICRAFKNSFCSPGELVSHVNLSHLSLPFEMMLVRL